MQICCPCPNCGSRALLNDPFSTQVIYRVALSAPAAAQNPTMTETSAAVESSKSATSVGSSPVGPVTSNTAPANSAVVQSSQSAAAPAGTLSSGIEGAPANAPLQNLTLAQQAAANANKWRTDRKMALVDFINNTLPDVLTEKILSASCSGAFKVVVSMFNLYKKIGSPLKTNPAPKPSVNGSITFDEWNGLEGTDEWLGKGGLVPLLKARMAQNGFKTEVIGDGGGDVLICISWD